MFTQNVVNSGGSVLPQADKILTVFVLVSDQPNRSAALAEALSSLDTCEVVAPSLDWATLNGAAAVILDLDASQSTLINCLRALRLQNWAAKVPVLCLSYRFSDKALRQAQSLSVSACMPFYTEPHLIVTAVLNLINPAQSSLNAKVRQCADQAASALGKLFNFAEEEGLVDLGAIRGCVDPLLSALEQGGLARWLNTIRAHDNATYQHTLVVAGLAAQFGAHVGFSDAQRQRAVRAALVHDIGKTRIPRMLLLKRGSLDANETAVMRTHTVLGFKILSADREADSAMLDAVRHHHEMLDGSGYPDGLSGDAISDVVRFLTICDIYATLTEHRPYKPAMNSLDAMRTLRRMNGKVEPLFVQAFDKALGHAIP